MTQLPKKGEVPRAPALTTGALAVSLGLMSVMGCHGSRNGSAEQDSFRKASVGLLKDLATQKLTDPESARFRNLKLYFQPAPGSDKSDAAPSGTYSLCGEVSARNQLGGYVGYKPFVSTVFINGATKSFADAPKGAFIERDFAQDDFQKSFFLPNCKGEAAPVD